MGCGSLGGGRCALKGSVLVVVSVVEGLISRGLLVADDVEVIGGY